MTLLSATDRGLYCEAGDFFVDPWAAVDRAVVTHAHGDHVAWGCRGYLTAEPGVPVLRERLDPSAPIRGAAYGEALDVGGVRVSLHPAGHILGSAQVRIEHAGEVWVVSGDYKTEPDPTCAPFEPVRCDTFVTESHLRAADLPLAGTRTGRGRHPRLVARQPGGRQGLAPLRLRPRQGTAAPRRRSTPGSARFSLTARSNG